MSKGQDTLIVHSGHRPDGRDGEISIGQRRPHRCPRLQLGIVSGGIAAAAAEARRRDDTQAHRIQLLLQESLGFPVKTTDKDGGFKVEIERRRRLFFAALLGITIRGRGIFLRRRRFRFLLRRVFSFLRFRPSRVQKVDLLRWFVLGGAATKAEADSFSRLSGLLCFLFLFLCRPLRPLFRRFLDINNRVPLLILRIGHIPKGEHVFDGGD